MGEVKRAKEFLLKHRDRDGKFFGFQISTGLSISIFGGEIAQSSLEIVKEWVSEETDASFLCWYLECLEGLPEDYSLIKICLEKIIELRKEEGFWEGLDGKKYKVSTTIGALKMLRKYRMIQG